MIKWSILREYISEGKLKDPSSTRYTKDQMLIWARWACAHISQHTAESSVMHWEVDGTQKSFPLPDDLIDPLDKSGLVAVVTNQQVAYIKNFRQYPDLVWPVESRVPRDCFWEWPTGTLNLATAPKAGSRVSVYYFRIWTPPTKDDDELKFPLWMEEPFACLVAAGAMNPTATQAANIRQYNGKQDSGTPEHNPVLRQAEWFVQEANRLLSLHAPQDRSNFYGPERS